MRLYSILPIFLLSVWLLNWSLIAQPTANKRSSYYTKVQSGSQNFSEFSGFLYLFRKKASIPKDLLLKYAPSTPPKGNFQAKGIYRLPNGIAVLVLEQKSSMCVRQHLMTSNGQKILSQRLVSERCTPAPGAKSNEYSALEYEEGRGFLQVLYKDIFLPEKDRQVLGRRLLKISSKGDIIPASM